MVAHIRVRANHLHNPADVQVKHPVGEAAYSAPCHQDFDVNEFLMSLVRRGVTEFIAAGKSLLEMKNLSQEEEQAIRDMLGQLGIRFPDEGDDAAD